MEKVFEALEILSRALEFNDEGEFQSGRLWRIIFNDMVDDKEKAIIEEALTELKAIKESKPSEALNCVDILKEDGCITTLYQAKALNTIRGYILKAQELEKVLEIIKKKDVDIKSLKLAENWLDYYTIVKHKTGKNTELTQEEFDTLKRYFEKNIQKQ